MPPTGRPGDWRPSTGSAIRPWPRSGGRSVSSRGGRTPSSGPPDPDLVEKIRDIVALYVNPPVTAVVFAVDEKPQIQALNRTAPTFPMLPTTAARANHDYQRNGTCDLFAALDIASGTVITDIRSSHTSDDFISFLNRVNRNVPTELDVHVVLDNLSAHKNPKVRAGCGATAGSTSISGRPTGHG